MPAVVSEQPVLDERRAPRPPRWGLGDAAVGYLAAIVLSTLTGGLWIGVTGQDDASLGLIVVSLAGQWVGLAGAVLVASRQKGSGRLDEDFGLRVEARDILPGVAAGLLSQFLLIPLLYLPFRALNPDLDLSSEARRITGLASGGGIVLLAVCILLVAPLVEELFFRGLLQRALTRRFGPGWGIAVSSLAFGVAHYQPVQLLGLVAFGLVLALLAERAGRLGPSLVAHTAFNAATVILLVALR